MSQIITLELSYAAHELGIDVDATGNLMMVSNLEDMVFFGNPDDGS